jgi:large conductance mechanosensitive channel
MHQFFKNFKEFAVKGNVVDLAVGIIIGTAFNKIVQSFVNDIIMPPFGLIWGDKDFTKYKWVLQQKTLNDVGKVTEEEVAINFGNFLAVTLDFLIIGMAIFIVIRFINSLKKKAEDPQNTEVPTPKDILLLTEIRDLLKKDKEA